MEAKGSRAEKRGRTAGYNQRAAIVSGTGTAGQIRKFRGDTGAGWLCAGSPMVSRYHSYLDPLAELGYETTPEQRALAHVLIDLDACDVLDGHSLNHALAIEIYCGKPIMYGR